MKDEFDILKVIGMKLRDALEHINTITPKKPICLPEIYKESHKTTIDEIYIYSDRNRIVTGVLLT